MQITSLVLHHFRNYSSKTFQFSPKITVIVGENARGKTNILEAIVLLSTGESFHARRIEEMVQWGKEVGRVKGAVTSKNGDESIEVVVTTGMVQGERVQKRTYLLDGVSKRKKDMVGHLLTVVFRPEDLDLIAGSPSIRRSFLNIVLSQTHAEYRYSLDAYEKALKRRNALLDVLREGKTTRASFTFWDQLLVKHGNILTNMRRDFIDYINNTQDFPMKFSLTYDTSTISEKRLHQYAIEEVAAGYTLVGPHKDDISIALANGKEKNLATFGSRGEQRMGVLWLKYHELMYIEHVCSERPVLLLDDIFSELDEKHKEMVTELTQRQQTIFTTTERELPRHTKHETILL